MIKILYPDFLAEQSNLVAGWPNTSLGLRFAKEVRAGQELAAYITDPLKKVVGILRVTGDYFHDPVSRWPYQTPVEWVIGPKTGLSLSQIGLDIVPSKGATAYKIGSAHMATIRQKLSTLPDML